MGSSLMLVLQLWILLCSMRSTLVQGQGYSYSETCQLACINDRLYQRPVDGTYNFCRTVVYEDFKSCFCRECPLSDLSEVNRLIGNHCEKENLPAFDCSGSSGTSSTTSSSSSSSRTSLSTLRTSTSTSSPTSLAGANSESDDSSGGSTSSSGGRKGSKSSSGIKAGISVGVVVGIFVILGIFYFVVGRWKFEKLKKQKAAQNLGVDGATAGSLPPPPQSQSQPQPQPPVYYQNDVNATEKPTFVPNQTTWNAGYPAQPVPQAYHEMSVVQQPNGYQHPQVPQGNPGWGVNPQTPNNGWAPNR